MDTSKNVRKTFLLVLLLIVATFFSGCGHLQEPTPPTINIIGNHINENGREEFAFSKNANITLQCSVTDEQDGKIVGDSITWSIVFAQYIAKQLGTGCNLQLKPFFLKGKYLLRVTATNSENLSTSQNITLRIGHYPPTASIIANRTVFTFGQVAYLEAAITDVEDREESFSRNIIVWTFSGSKQPIGYGHLFNVGSLSIGNHSLILTATDSDGNIGFSEPLNITVE